jgi:tetratricopeptide (TPR) repeat protein
MRDSIPPITPAQRQRLQKLWEEARGLMVRAGSPGSRNEADKIHEVLAECVAGDPGNTVYLDAFLLNLRQLRSQQRGWWKNIFGRPYSDTHGPAALKNCSGEDAFLSQLLRLADFSSQIDAPEAEIRYLQEALHYQPGDEAILRKVISSLLRQGRFDEARTVAIALRETTGHSQEMKVLERLFLGPQGFNNRVALSLPSIEVKARLESASPDDYRELASALAEVFEFDKAEAAAAKALSLSGGDLAVREQVEDISLARLKNNVAIARRLVEHEPSEAHQQTLRRWEDELGRLELETLNARSERFPQDASLKLQVAVRLKQAGNYSGAAQRLEEIAISESLRPQVLIELGECWQHLRQFEKALDIYTQAIASAEGREQQEPLQLALYRAAILAAAMQRTVDAKAWLEQLISLAPDFKDAQQRLKNLTT